MDDRISNKSQCGFKDPGVSLTNVFPFCNQLEKFIKYIENVRDLNFLTYDYPNILKNQLDVNVDQLESTLAEVKEAVANIERLKTQKKLIKKEKSTVKKFLKRLRDDEVREMECVISLYDKPMFSRWETVKTTHKPEVLEGILSDVKGKQLALENLSVLITRRLNQIQAFQPMFGKEADKSFAGLREKTIIPLPFPSFCTPILTPPPPPPPPPLPPPLVLPTFVPASVSHLPKRSHAQRLSIQRRRRLERRDDNLERRSVVTANVDDLSLVPLTLNELPSNLYPAVLNTTSNSNHNVVSVENGSNDVTLSNNDSNNNNGIRQIGIEFQSEMRTVLQALFGELRSAPTLITTNDTSNNLTESEDTSNTAREIELYTLRKTQ